jgi:hypothetical protein
MYVTMFAVNKKEIKKDDSSLEAHLQSLKTSRGSYLGKENDPFLSFLFCI